MAISPSSFQFARCSAIVANSVAPDREVPDNCKEIVIVNRSGNRVLFTQAVAGGVLADDNTTGEIPANSTVQLAVGVTVERPSGSMTAASGRGLAFQSQVGPATLSLTYVCESAGLRR